MPNKLSQFWLELKRRKVVRVITVYAAAAFVILELLSIIIEPLRLPDWTLQFAIKANAAAVILAHNHPSGNLGASEADKRITGNVKEALKLVDIELLDHLFLTYEEKFATIEMDVSSYK